MEKKPLPKSDEPNTNIAHRIISFLICSSILVVIVMFLVSKYRQAYFTSVNNRVIDSLYRNVNIEKYNYSGISYLIFTKAGALQVINFTADSVKLVEYIDYQQSIADTPYIENPVLRIFHNK
jgi:hypothetical protein